MKILERVLRALANRRRLEIVKYLGQVKEANVTDIAHHIKLSFKATSRHLSVLSSADIVEKEQRSLEMWYRLSAKRHSLAKYVSNFF